MTTRRLPLATTSMALLATLMVTSSCDDARDANNSAAQEEPGHTAGSARDGASGANLSKAREGQDYVVLQRMRLLDQQGFDQPVEAMSVLVPKGWRTESEVRWRGIGECRGDIVTWQMKATSPDGAIQFVVLPLKTFVASQNSMIHQSLVAASQQGGCAVSAPFDARQYSDQLARSELGATLSDVRNDDNLQQRLQQLYAQNNALSQQYGTNMRYSGGAVFGTLSWPDNSRGLLHVGVSRIEGGGTDYYGNPSGSATTSVFYQVYVRYPREREQEALRTFATITSSHRINPVWQQAKDRFLTQLGNLEHAGRMERIRLMGEQARAYARAQSEASDARMRDWERAQAQSDANQSRFIQTIREVETWKDASGAPVELNAGWTYGWSRPDGTYLLTNNSLFDPKIEFKEDWSKMQKVQR